MYSTMVGVSVRVYIVLVYVACMGRNKVWCGTLGNKGKGLLLTRNGCTVKVWTGYPGSFAGAGSRRELVVS
jgi:hypothetical protein